MAASIPSIIHLTQRLAQQSTGNSESKDIWDKLDIIASLLSSVVIAVAALIVSVAVQRAQIRSAEVRAVADRDSADRRAKADQALQQSQLAGNLVEHLSSTSAVQREIAIVALRSGVPSSMHQQILAVLARSDLSEGVREEAIDQLGAAEAPAAVPTLKSIALDNDRSPRERKLASFSAERIAAAGLSRTQGIAIFGSSQLSSDVGFANAVAEGLSGAAAGDDGKVTVSGLYAFIHEALAPLGEVPYLTFEGTGEPTLVSPLPEYRMVRAVMVAANSYDHLPPLPYAIGAVERVAHVLESRWRSVGVPVEITMVSGAYSTRASVLDALRTVSGSHVSDLVVVFYSGHSTLGAGADLYLAASDSTTNDTGTWIAARDVADAMRTGDGMRVLFLDSDSAALTESK